MANFYDAFTGQYSQGSFNYKSDSSTGHLPLLAYAQGHSATGIHIPRAAIPMVGRDGYKNILVYRVNDGSAANRTITQQDDLFVREYFVETDRITRSRFKVIPDSQSTLVLTPANFTTHIEGALLPNGEIVPINSSSIDTFRKLVLSIRDNSYDIYQKIPLDGPLRASKLFGTENFVYLAFILGRPKYEVSFPDGGITQVPNFRVLTEVIGDNGEYNKKTPYTDMMKFDPIEFVKSDAPPGMFPDVTPSSSYTENVRRLFNGIIEPFNIRTSIYDLDTFAKSDKVKPNNVGGSVMHIVEPFAKLSETLNAGFAPVIDIGNTRAGGGLLEPEFILESKFELDPFVEIDPVGRGVDPEIRSLLQKSFRLNQGFLPEGTIGYTGGAILPAHEQGNTRNYRGRLR